MGAEDVTVRKFVVVKMVFMKVPFPLWQLKKKKKGPLKEKVSERNTTKLQVR